MATRTTKSGDSLKALNSKLKGLKVSLNNIRQFVKNYKEDTTASQVNVRLARLDLLWEQISETFWEIQGHDDYEEQEGFEKEQLGYENSFYDTKSFLMEKAQEFQNEIISNHSIRSPDAASSHGTLNRVRLPQIVLQTFDGNIDGWPSFRDLYTSLIHQKPDLPDVEKFHYLKGWLAGEAKALLDPLKITTENYTIAWALLLKRFNNSKLLKRKQVQALMKIPALTRESFKDLHKLVDGFERAVQILDQIIEPAEYKDLLLVELLSSRLDPATRRGWEEHTSAKEQDTLMDLQEFLQRRIQVLESLPAKLDRRSELQPVKPKTFLTKVNHNAVHLAVFQVPIMYGDS